MNKKSQQYCPQHPIKTCTFRLYPGNDLNKSLRKFIKDNKIKAGIILTTVGSLKQACLRFANQPSYTILAEGYYEIVALVGTVSVNGSHLHAAFSDKEGRTYGGHLGDGNIIYTTAEITIGVIEHLEFKREINGSEYRELVVVDLA